MYWQNEKIVSFVHFSNKRRFEQIYKTSLWNETVKQITDVFCKTKVFLEISQNVPESTCVGVSFLIKLQVSNLKLC